MIIEKISIESFGKLSGFEATFDPVLNIIEGPNESGKSTLAAFIRYMLYGFSTATSSELGERRHRLSWDSAVAAGSMEVLAKGKRYRIERSTRAVTTHSGRDSYKEDSQILDLSTGKPVFAKTQAGEALLGVPEEVFLNTAFVDQMTHSRVGDKEMTVAIENLLFSGDERISTQRAMEKLDSARRALLHKNGKGGAIYELHRNAEELQKRLAIAVKENSFILDKQSLLEATEAKRDHYIAEETESVRLENDYRNAQLIRTYDTLHELEQKAEQIAKQIEAHERENRKDGFLPDGDYITELAVARRAYTDAAKNRAAAEVEYDAFINRNPLDEKTEELICRCDSAGGEDAVLDAHIAMQESRNRYGLFSVISAVLAAFLVAFAGIFGFSELSFAFFAWLCLLIGFLIVTGTTGYFAVRATKNAREICAEYGAQNRAGLIEQMNCAREARNTVLSNRAALDTARANADRMRAAEENAKQELSDLLAKVGFTLSEQGDRTDEMITELSERVHTYLEEHAALLSQKAEADQGIQDVRQRLKDKNEVAVRALVSPARREELAKMDHERILSAIEYARRMIHFYDQRYNDVRLQLTEARARAEDPAVLSEQLCELNEKIEHLQRQYDAYVSAYDAIAGAGERLRAEISPRLTEYAAGILAEMTDGKYERIGVSGELAVSFTEKEVTRSMQYLSTGTQDITYLSLRMSLIDLLYKEAPPLCLDESFAHQDKKRASGLMQAIRRLGEEGKQTFLFTCHGREAELAKETFGTYGHIYLRDGDEAE